MDHLSGQTAILLPRDVADRAEPPRRAPLATNAVSEKDKAVVYVGNMGFLHIQRKVQRVFEEGPTGFTHRFGAFDHDDKVVGVPTVRDSRLPFTVLSHGNRALSTHPVVPSPSVFSDLGMEILGVHPLVEFVQHDIRQNWRNDAPLRNSCMRCAEQLVFDVPRLDKAPKEVKEPSVVYPASDRFRQQSVMNRVKVARQITLDDPTTCRRSLRIVPQQLEFHGSNRMMDTATWPKSIGRGMKVAFPNGFHHHEHRALDDAVAQSGDTQRAPFSVFLRNVHPASRVGLIGAGQKLLADVREFLGQMRFHLAFPNAINVMRAASASRSERSRATHRDPHR